MKTAERTMYVNYSHETRFYIYILLVHGNESALEKNTDTSSYVHFETTFALLWNYHFISR